MTTVTELDLPAFDYTAPDFAADRYHHQLAQVRAQGWLARSPLAYLVLDREAGEFFLRSRAAAFPGRQIAEFFGITSGPLWDHIDTNILNLTGTAAPAAAGAGRAGVHPARGRPLAAGDAGLPGPAVGRGEPGHDVRVHGRGGPALSGADDRGRARRARGGRAAAAGVVEPGAAPVRHRGAAVPGARDRAGRGRGQRVRGRAAGRTAGTAAGRPGQRAAGGAKWTGTGGSVPASA